MIPAQEIKDMYENFFWKGHQSGFKFVVKRQLVISNKHNKKQPYTFSNTHNIAKYAVDEYEE